MDTALAREAGIRVLGLAGPLSSCVILAKSLGSSWPCFIFWETEGRTMLGSLYVIPSFGNSGRPEFHPVYDPRLLLTWGQVTVPAWASVFLIHPVGR